MADKDPLPGISPDPIRFEEAIAAIRRRVPMTEDVFDILEADEREFAFTVANVAQLDMVVDVYEAVERAVAEGRTLEDFKADVGDALERAWGEENPARLEAIFRTNTMGAYNSGRHEAAQKVKRERPYWRFDGPIDDRTSKDICLPIVRAGVILPADHPYWRRHYPPLHVNCFAPGAMITTARGPVPIEDVTLGDEVLTHRGRLRKVTGLLRSPAPQALFHLGLVNGRHLSGGTAEHPAFTDRGWVELSSLRPGDRLLYARELPLGDVEVRDGHHPDSVLEEGLEASGRHPIRVAGKLDSQVGIRQEEVGEEQIITQKERLLKDHRSTGAPNPGQEQPLDPAGPHLRKHVRRWIRAMVGLFRRHGLGQGLRSLCPSALTKLGGHAGDARMGLLGMALAPVCDARGSSFGHGLREARGSSGAAYGVVLPLPSDSFGSVAERDAVLPQQPLGGPGSVGIADDLGDLAHGQAVVDVELAQVGARLGAVNFEELALDWSHADRFVATWEVAQKVEVRQFAGRTVYNLSVEEDESYVADGVVVHNCRHRVSTLTKEQAEEQGITKSPPDVEVPDGFGKPPSSSGGSDWEPDPADYPEDLAAALEEREAG